MPVLSRVRTCFQASVPWGRAGLHCRLSCHFLQTEFPKRSDCLIPNFVFVFSTPPRPRYPQMLLACWMVSSAHGWGRESSGSSVILLSWEPAFPGACSVLYTVGLTVNLSGKYSPQSLAISHSLCGPSVLAQGCNLSKDDSG